MITPSVPSLQKLVGNTLSVVAWVFAESRPRWASIAKRWGEPGDRSFHFGLFGDDGDLEVHVTQPNGEESLAREGRPATHGSLAPRRVRRGWASTSASTVTGSRSRRPITRGSSRVSSTCLASGSSSTRPAPGRTRSSRVTGMGGSMRSRSSPSRSYPIRYVGSTSWPRGLNQTANPESGRAGRGQSRARPLIPKWAAETTVIAFQRHILDQKRRFIMHRPPGSTPQVPRLDPHRRVRLVAGPDRLRLGRRQHPTEQAQKGQEAAKSSMEYMRKQHCGIESRVQDTIETGAEGPLTPRFSRVALAGPAPSGHRRHPPPRQGDPRVRSTVPTGLRPFNQFPALSLHRGDP